MEDPRLLRGQGRFVDDVRLPGLLHAAFARSLYPHATLIGVEVSAARAAPGFAAILTGRDLEDVQPLAPRLDAPGFAGTEWPALAISRVRFAGEPVAVAAAEDAYAAADAAEHVAIEYAPLPAVADVAGALAADAPRLHPGHRDNVLFTRAHRHGDVDGAFATAAVVIRETFSHARCSAAPLEGRGVVARWERDLLTVWISTQVPSIVRSALARAFALPERCVRVIVPDTGGGFGQKMHLMPEDVAVVALARRTGRPVKWIETRRENLAAASQARDEQVEIEAAADARGVVLALRARVVSDAGAYHVHPLTAALEPMGTAGILPGPYRIRAYAFEVRAVATNKPPLGAYRGVGMTMGALVMERTIDLLAARLGVDPVEIRRRNLIARDEYPFRSPAGFVYDSGDFPAALDRALALADYERLARERDDARRAGRLFGVGVSCYTEYTGMGSETYRRRGMVEVPGSEAASVRIEDDGAVTCSLSFPCQGQGHATTVAQIVADELGVPLAQVSVLQPDTETAPAGTGTFASRGGIAQAGAVAPAASAVRRMLLSAAAAALEASEADLVMAAGRVSVRGAPDRGLTFAELARLARSEARSDAGVVSRGGLVATELFDPPAAAFSGAVHVAAVEVDPDTGRVQVREYAVVEDCGPVINPLIVEGQIHGAVAQGIGEALAERIVHGPNAELVTGTLMDYPLPVATGLPFVNVEHIETPSPLTPGGYKGMGEGGTIGAPAAIANAVADAVRHLGVRVTAIPILPEGLVQMPAAGS